MDCSYQDYIEHFPFSEYKPIWYASDSGHCLSYYCNDMCTLRLGPVWVLRTMLPHDNGFSKLYQLLAVSFEFSEELVIKTRFVECVFTWKFWTAVHKCQHGISYFLDNDKLAFISCDFIVWQFVLTELSLSATYVCPSGSCREAVAHGLYGNPSQTTMTFSIFVWYDEPAERATCVLSVRLHVCSRVANREQLIVLSRYWMCKSCCHICQYIAILVKLNNCVNSVFR